MLEGVTVPYSIYQSSTTYNEGKSLYTLDVLTLRNNKYLSPSQGVNILIVGNPTGTSESNTSKHVISNDMWYQTLGT